MLDVTSCDECANEYPLARRQLGYNVCLVCGEKLARSFKHTIVPMHKSNYVVISNKQELQGINNKGCQIK